jgi:hypothetical protein
MYRWQDPDVIVQWLAAGFGLAFFGELGILAAFNFGWLPW